MAAIPPLLALGGAKKRREEGRSAGANPAREVDDGPRALIMKILTEGGEPEKICRHWSLWCDLKSGDAECFRGEDGKNPDDNEHWRQGCVLLGVKPSLKTPQELGYEREEDRKAVAATERVLGMESYPVTWRGMFNYLCDVLHHISEGRNTRDQTLWSWYLMWLRERSAISTNGPSFFLERMGPYGAWFKTCAGEIKLVDMAEGALVLSFRARILWSIVNSYAAGLHEFGDFARVARTHVGSRRGILGLIRNDPDLAGPWVQYRLEAWYGEGVNPRALWFTLLEIEGNDGSPDEPRVGGERLDTMVRVLLKHSAISPDLIAAEVVHQQNLRHASLAQDRLTANQIKSVGIRNGAENTMLVKVMTRGPFSPHDVIYPRANYEKEWRATLSTATALLEAGANPNVLVVDPPTKQPLLSLMVEKRGTTQVTLELIELLLKHGADTEALDTADENARPLVHAIEFSDKDLVKLLVDNGARVHDEDVVFALRMGNFAIAAVLGAALRRAPAHPLKKALEAAATLRELLEGYPEVRGF